MATFTTILDEIKSLIAGITEDNGYSYDAGSVGERDMAHMTFPAYEIDYEPEENVFGEDSPLRFYRFVRRELLIRVRGDIETTASLPENGVDELYNMYKRDILAVTLASNGVLPLSGSPVVSYVREERPKILRGDRYIPKHSELIFTVRYQDT